MRKEVTCAFPGTHGLKMKDTKVRYSRANLIIKLPAKN